MLIPTNGRYMYFKNKCHLRIEMHRCTRVMYIYIRYLRVQSLDKTCITLTLFTGSDFATRSGDTLAPALVKGTMEAPSITELVHKEENYVPRSW